MSATIDTGGLVLRRPPRVPVVVEIEGRYVWSFHPDRDGVASPEGLHVPWPAVLRPFLVGTGHVRLSTADAAEVLHDDDVAFDADPARVAVRDRAGNPLAIDKVGHLTRAFLETDHAIRTEILEGTRRALDDLQQHAGVEAYLNYGALLGAVRDGAMIGHDSDTDVCYLSRHTSPADLVAESYRVERAMRAQGWNLLRMSGGDVKLLLPLSDGRTCHIDVFVAFHVRGTFYQLGNRSGDLPREAIVPLGRIALHGVDFPAPRDPEAMLAFLYGPQWRTPDPSFRYADPPAGVRRLNGWLRGFRTHMGRWSEYYSGPDGTTLPDEPADFAHWVDRTLPAGAPLAELGSGIGREAAALARAGRDIVALDFNRVARARTRRRFRRAGLALDQRVLILGDLRHVLLAGTELHRERRHLVARHLLGCLDPVERAYFWRLVGLALRDGGDLLLEFPAAGAGHPDPEPAGLVRRVLADDVAAAVDRAGGSLVSVATGPGTDLRGSPDPAVCRLHARWSGTRHPSPPPNAQESPVSAHPSDPRPTIRQRVARATRRLRTGSDPALLERLHALEVEVQENRELNRRIAELIDVVGGLLVHVHDRDDEQVEQALARYRASI